MQTIARFYETWEAQMLLGRLRSEGIPAFLASELQVANQWWSGIALGGCEVQVPDEFADEARAVLQRNYREERKRKSGQSTGSIARIAKPRATARSGRL